MNDPLAPVTPASGTRIWLTFCLHLLAVLLLILTPLLLARAQKPEGSVTVLDVTARPVANTTLVTITADGSLSNAQTWQDQEGYHVVVPGGQPSERIKPGKGYKVRRSGTAVEVLLNTKPGTPVQLRTDAHQLNLSVTGELESSDASSLDSGQSYSIPEYPKSSSALSSAGESADSSQGENAPQEPTQPDTAAKERGEVASTITVGEAQGGSLFTSIFSWTGVAVVVVLAAIALFVTHKFRRDSGWEDEPAEASAAQDEQPAAEQDRVTKKVSKTKESKASRTNGRGQREGKADVRSAAPPPISHYSAYRINQEIRKLATGQPHRTEVISSRAPEDRRAVETALVKVITTPESSADECQRAREALEAYGFVARASAIMLSASDPFDRTAAARTLGEIGSVAALSSLIEALHDSEAIVRNQVISSIGELKEPSAIGALIDVARNRPEFPSNLLSRALTSCSIEAVELLDGTISSFSSAHVDESGLFDFAQLGQGDCSIEELPETIEDASLNLALTRANSDSAEERGEAVKTLAQYPVKTAIATLVAMAKHDAESMVRALAMSSLGFIDHELVFPAVLIGMADESRDVRAAAARALSRLSFDRSAAYGSLVQTADDQTLRDVAQACIKAGIVSQNIDRLASRDRRQAYEAFCLISLLIKVGIAAPVLEAIEHHSNMTVRLSVIHLLASTGDDGVFDQLQQIAGKEELDEEIKTAALNEMYTMQQASRREAEPTSSLNSEQASYLSTEPSGNEVQM